MCDFHASGHHGLPALAEDEYVLDTPRVREFVGRAVAVISAARSAPEACEALRPDFVELLADRDWLPGEFQRDVPDSGMGGGIGQWLLYRAADRSLCLFSLVVPSGSMTPIHDHLAWGLIGLYRGSQDEEFYRPGDGAIECTRRRPLGARRPLRAAPAAGRRPPRPHHLRHDVGVDPPARQRHGLHDPSHLRRAHRRGGGVPLGLRERRMHVERMRITRAVALSRTSLLAS